MMKILRVEGEVCLEGGAFCFDVAKDIQALLVPAEFPSEDCRQHHDYEAIRNVSDPRRPRLQALLHFAQHHDDCESSKGHCARNLARFRRVAEQEHDLVETASMRTRGRVRSSSVQTHLGDKLIDEYDHTNSADEAAEERSAEYRVQEAKSAKSSCENDSARKTGHHACHLGILAACSISVMSRIDGFAYHLTC